MHEALAAEHRTRFAMQSGQWAHDNAAEPEPVEALTPAEIAEDVADEWTRNPAAIANWLNDESHQHGDPIPFRTLREMSYDPDSQRPAVLLAMLFGGALSKADICSTVYALQAAYAEAIKRDAHYIEQCGLRGAA